MSSDQNLKLSDFVAGFVASLGIKHVFTLPGGGCMHLTDSFGCHPEIENICNLHEQACAIAADAYSQYTGKMGVCLVTTGPGGTNTITGVAGSWLDSIPVLVISGQVKTEDMAGDRGVRQMGFQEIDIVRLVSPITKYAVTVTDPDAIAYHLEKAVHEATSGRPGPVWIDIPLDIQAKEINPDRLRRFKPEPNRTTHSGNDVGTAAEQLTGLLYRAKRPVILAGNGVRLSGGLEEFRSLIRQLKIPVLTTWKAIDFLDEQDSCYCGRPGSIGQRGANFTQQNADLLIDLGARLDFGQTGYRHKNFAPHAKLCMVDTDIYEITKMDRRVDLPVHADCRQFLTSLIHHPALQDLLNLPSRWGQWLCMCKNWQAKYPVILPEYRRESSPINAYALIDVLSDHLGKEDLIIPGSSGACSEVTMQAFRVKSGQRVFNTEGLGPMGFGIPASLGGCVASGGRRTICIDGDGGFIMNIQELETIARLDLPIKFFVLNNAGYGSIRNTQNTYFEGRLVASHRESGLTLPDICKVADGFQIRHYQLKTREELDHLIDEILEFKGPVVCDVITPFNHVTAPRLMSVQKSDGNFESRPLEDLWPFLTPEDLEENMRISTESQPEEK